MALTNLKYGETASARVLELMRRSYTFQISVDTNNLPRGLVVAAAALAAGVTLVEMGTPRRTKFVSVDGPLQEGSIAVSQ
jgi:hypothetical protein